MIDGVQKRTRHRHRRRSRQIRGLEGKGEADADEDDADVFDRREGEHPLELFVENGIEQPPDGGCRADRDERHGPPPDRFAQKIEDDAHNGVDRDLGHHPAHQRRYVAWRHRVGKRQPCVQRHEAGLRAGANEGCCQHEPAPKRVEVMAADHIESIAAGGARHSAKGEQQRHGPDQRHDQVNVPCLPAIGVFVSGNHERP